MDFVPERTKGGYEVFLQVHFIFHIIFSIVRPYHSLLDIIIYVLLYRDIHILKLLSSIIIGIHYNKWPQSNMPNGMDS